MTLESLNEHADLLIFLVLVLGGLVHSSWASSFKRLESKVDTIQSLEDRVTALEIRCEMKSERRYCDE